MHPSGSWQRQWRARRWHADADRGGTVKSCCGWALPFPLVDVAVVIATWSRERTRSRVEGILKLSVLKGCGALS